MRSWIGKLVMRWAYGCINEGRPEPVLRLISDDIVFTFPGDNRWGRTYRGKHALESFMRELYSLGLTFTVHDVLVKGWPWNMTVAVVISDEARGPDGELTYSNRAVEVWKARWTKIVSGELFEDTQKATAWDVYLREHEPARA
jgi:ketosteroid isomerase-like protein